MVLYHINFSINIKNPSQDSIIMILQLFSISIFNSCCTINPLLQTTFTIYLVYINVLTNKTVFYIDCFTLILHSKGPLISQHHLILTLKRQFFCNIIVDSCRLGCFFLFERFFIYGEKSFAYY